MKQKTVEYNPISDFNMKFVLRIFIISEQMYYELFNSDIVICGVLLFGDFFFFFTRPLFFSSLDAFYLSVPENYHYLNQSGCIADKTISDKDSFKEVIVSCLPSSLCFKNAGSSGTRGLLTEQGTKPSCAYLRMQLTH